MKVKTKCGLDATLFEIDPDDLQSAILGMAYTPGMGNIARRWSDVGLCSNSGDELHIDPKDPGFMLVVHQLRATRL